jgi:23S rRNA pseudouridine2605 synthase
MGLKKAMAQVRLQKLIAAAGLASRREAERMIAAGRVKVDGQAVTQMGVQVDPARARIEVDGRPLPQAGASVYLMLNKPGGVVASVHDERGRPTVMDLLGNLGATRGERRVFHVGRLDYHTEGLLLLTNDGALAMELTHPSGQVPRTYHARVRNQPSAETLARLARGVDLEDGLARAIDARVVRRNPKSAWVEICVVEGRNRLVRRMLEAVGHPVQRLVRIEFGGVELGDLRTGAVRELTAAEVEKLKRWHKSDEPGSASFGSGSP